MCFILIQTQKQRQKIMYILPKIGEKYEHVRTSDIYKVIDLDLEQEIYAGDPTGDVNVVITMARLAFGDLGSAVKCPLYQFDKKYIKYTENPNVN